jgi:hypothetical protein
MVRVPVTSLGQTASLNGGRGTNVMCVWRMDCRPVYLLP